MLNDQTERIDLTTIESRAALARMITKLFTLWSIPPSDQLDLLGLSPKSRSSLSRYSSGKALPQRRDVLDRTGYLLAIHKSLRLLYPKNEDICYTWVKQRNTAFDNFTPLEVMKKQGIIGMAKVDAYLESLKFS